MQYNQRKEKGKRKAESVVLGLRSAEIPEEHWIDSPIKWIHKSSRV